MPTKQGSRGRPSHATIVAYLALFVALGGTAGALAGKNTVDSRDIKPKNVKASDLAKGAVSGPKIRGGAVNGAKVLDETLGQADLGANSVGPPELELFKSSTSPGPVPLTGAGSQPIGPAITLSAPADNLTLFYAEADVARSAGTVQCRLEAQFGNTGVFLGEADVGFGGPAEPFETDLIPFVLPAGDVTVRLAGVLNGMTTETCTYSKMAFYGIVLG